MIRKLWPIAVSIIFLVALRVVYVELSHLRYHDLATALDALSGSRIGLALLCTIGSYLAMTIGELLAVRYASSPVGYSRVSFASFIGSSFNNSVGFSGLLGGTLRYRLYTSWGLTAAGADLSRVPRGIQTAGRADEHRVADLGIDARGGHEADAA